MREELGDAVFKVGVDDIGVDAKMAAIEAKFKAMSESIGRTKATIAINADIGDLKRNVDEAKARLVALRAEEDALAKQRTRDTGQELKQQADLVKAKQAEIAGVEQEIRKIQQEADGLTKYGNTLKEISGLEDQRARSQQIIDRAAVERNKIASDAEQYRLRELTQVRNGITLQQQYADAKARVDRLAKAATTTQGSEQQRVQLDQKGATADMMLLHERLRLIGEKPIVQRVDVDTSKAEKAWNLFTHGTLDGTATKTTIDDVTTKLKNMLGTKMNVGPFNASIGGVITVLGTLAPAIAAVGGAAGSLIAVLGSGIVGAAGLGGAALTGFGMAALGIKSALSNSMQQLTTFKSALNLYQAAQLKYGPASTTTPASTAAAARIPVVQARVAADQTWLNTATALYGPASMQAATASLALASAQNTLSTAQTRAAAGANRTQRALNALNSVIGQSSPPMRAAMRDWLALSSSWQNITGPTASSAFGGTLDQLFKTMRADVGFFGRDTNTTLKTLATGLTGWFVQLRQPEAQHFLDNIFKNFNQSLPAFLDGLGHIQSALGAWFSTMSNYLPAIANGFDKWATALDNVSGANNGWASGSRTLISSLEAIGHFGEAAAKWIYALFAPAVKPGNNFVEDMANSLDRTTKAMRTLQGQKNLSDFYSQSIKGTEALWKALVPLADVFIHLAELLAPLAAAAVPILTWFTKAAAAVTGFLGPIGKALVDVAAFVLVGRTLGKLTPLLSVFSLIGGAAKSAAGMVVRFGEAFAALKSGEGLAKITGAFAALRGEGKVAAQTQAQAIESALNTGAGTLGASIRESFAAGTETFVAGSRGAFTAGAGEVTAAERLGMIPAASEITAAEASGGAIAATELRAAMGLGGGLGAGGTATAATATAAPAVAEGSVIGMLASKIIPLAI